MNTRIAVRYTWDGENYVAGPYPTMQAAQAHADTLANLPGGVTNVEIVDDPEFATEQWGER